MQGRQLNAEDLRAFGEARLAALKAGLTLTPEQEKNDRGRWPSQHFDYCDSHHKTVDCA